MIAELQRMRRRTLARPLLVLGLAAALTAAITYKIVTRKPTIEADLVLLLTEGQLSSRHGNVPVDDLKEYVATVLLPNDKLAQLADKRHLNGLGRMDETIAELRESLAIRIWKNTFVYYDPDVEVAEHSARIGLTVESKDADAAYQRVNDFAQIIITTANELRRQGAAQLADEINDLRESLQRTVERLTRERSAKQLALTEARRLRQVGVSEALQLELVQIETEVKAAERRLVDIAHSNDTIADRIAAAGLDMGVSIVENNRPMQSEQHNFLVVLIIAIVGFGALLGSALVVGAFDGHIYDTDDVARLGLDVLGHVPGFSGDDVGSLRSRGASRARVPSFLRWRWPR
jgi:hypothetical protein